MSLSNEADRATVAYSRRLHGGSQVTVPVDPAGVVFDVRGRRGLRVIVGTTGGATPVNGTATTQECDAAGNVVPNSAAVAVPAGGWVEARWTFYKVVAATAPSTVAVV